MTKKQRRLGQLRIVLTLLQAVSVVLFIFFFITIYSAFNFINESEFYEKKMIKIDTIHSGGGRSGETEIYSGRGQLWDESKAFLIRRGSVLRDTFNIGDVIPVWAIKGKELVQVRDLNQDKFPKEKYQRRIVNYIVFGIIPIILLWVFRYYVHKKVKQLEKQNKQ
jgi:uncharacterized membrane protein